MTNQDMNMPEWNRCRCCNGEVDDFNNPVAKYTKADMLALLDEVYDDTRKNSMGSTHALSDAIRKIKQRIENE